MYKLNPKNNNKNKNNNNNSNNIITGKPRTYSSNSLLSANTITPIHYPKTNDGWALDLTPGEWVTRNCLNDLLEIDEDEKWCYDSIVAYDVQSGSIGLANNKGKRQRGDFRRRRWIRTCVRSYQPNVDPTATATTPHTSTHTIKIPASSSYHNIAKLLNHQTFNNSTTTTNNTTAATTSASTVSATNTTATVPAPQTGIPNVTSETTTTSMDTKKSGFYSTLNSLNQKLEQYTNSALKSTSSNDSSNNSNKKFESDQSESELDHYL
ncbi:unnamed protein product [[Candida] boidinii]|nr:unnamed protein product [[Candida] boidinii]